MRKSSRGHAATFVVGFFIIMVVFWIYSITVDYNHSNQLAEESYIAVKENFIMIQVNRTIQMIDNCMTGAPERYNEELKVVGSEIISHKDDVHAYLNGDIDLVGLVGDYLVLHPYYGYVVFDGGGGLVDGVAMDNVGDEASVRELDIYEKVELSENRVLYLYMTYEQMVEAVKVKIIPEIRNIRLADNGYVWVNEVVNYDGGDDYAIRRIHANLQDTEGQFLTTEATDAHGNRPYETELNGIKADGEITFEYYFKKMDSDFVSRKMSFAKLYEPFDWIVATGVHLDDLEAYLAEEKVDRTRTYRFQLIFAAAILVGLLGFFAWKMKMSLEVISYRSKNLELTDQLKIHATELEDAMAVLKATEEELIANEKRALTTQLVAGVAHEINTPLGLSLTCTTHIQDKLNGLTSEFEQGTLSKSGLVKYSDTLKETTDLLEKNLSKAIGLVENFKSVAVDMTTNERRAFEIGGYIREVSDNIGKSLKKEDYVFDVECLEEIVVDSYPGAIYQLITNLIINSIRHGFKESGEGQVKIDVAYEADDVVIKYSDNGGGISDDVAERIFDPFFTTGRLGGNTGLGMYIVKSLVDTTLGGSIELVRHGGDGVLFEIRFPKVAKE